MTLDGTTPVTEGFEKARYALSFLRRGLVHTNLQLLYEGDFRCQICDFWRPEYQGAPRLSLADVRVIAAKLAEVGPCDAGKNLLNIDSQGNVTLCIDRLDDPVGNILADEMGTLARRLRERHERNDCRACWTSCRGAIETLMYGDDFGPSFADYWGMTRSVALSR